MYRIFQTLINEFGHKIMIPFLKYSIEKLKITSPNEMVANFFELVQNVNTNVVLLQKHYFTKIKPYVEVSKNEQTLCLTEKDQLMRSLEDNIESGLEKALSCMSFLF